MPRQTLKKRKDGRYRCKYKELYFYGYTPSEAFSARDAYKRDEALGIRIDQLGVSFERYASRWLPAYKSHLTTRPYNTHARIIDKFCSMYGSKPIKDISATDIQIFFDSYAGMSQSSINDARDTIKGIFSAALADRVITYDPCTKVNIPKGTKGTHRSITEKERQLIHWTEHNRMRAGVMLMLYAGLRRGEALAIDIDRDIDFRRKVITVREAVRFTLQGLPQIVDPKTEAGEREVPLLDILSDELQGKHGLILQSASGGLMTESSFDRAWQSYITSLETTLNGSKKRWYAKTDSQFEKGPLPLWRSISIRPHDLRHSYCSMLYDFGVDLKTAMKWMGHADQTMTLKIYTHLSEERENESRLALAEGINNSLRGQNGGHLFFK